MTVTSATLPGRAAPPIAAARPKTLRLVPRLLAAIEAHTRRQIELALGARISEFHRAIRESRLRESQKEPS
jgi:hypothetical protein